ncbi:MAG: glycosyltransferase family 2 protein [Desulfobacteraceae bacterium]|nr:glycosyltransferase family 2 protein [Desulfobacteraceae bacterium]
MNRQKEAIIKDERRDNEMEITGVSVVIPAFNEESIIGPVLSQLTNFIEESELAYEIIVVDDGSVDNTVEIVSQFPVKLLRHSSNKGYGAALKSGIRMSSYDLIVTFDADGQHNATDISGLIELAKTNDMVVGSRDKNSHISRIRRPGKWLLSVVANYLAGKKIPDLNSGFRAFPRDLALRFMHILPNGFSFTTTITLAIIKEGLDIAWFPITTKKRVGSSTVKPIKDGYNTILLILRTIVLFDPLKVFLPPSITLGLFGIIFSSYGLIRFGSFPETGVLVTLAAILLFFFGILADQVSALRRGIGQ